LSVPHTSVVSFGVLLFFVFFLMPCGAQSDADRMHAKTRRETVEQDRRYDKSLVFAGKSE
jgi:hypothetical protein